MLPAVFKLVADKPYPVKVCPHRKLLVFHLRLLGAGALLRQCLMVERQGQNNVASYLACVKGAVEAPELYRMIPREKAVEVEKMISA